MRKEAKSIQEEKTMEDPDTQEVIPEIQRHHYSLSHSMKKPYASKESQRNPKVSPYIHQRRRYVQNQLQGELRKIKPPTFDGENKMGEDVEAWLLGIRKYF
jgi:hypothetical protein